MPDRFASTETPEHTFFVVSAIVCAVRDELAIAITYPEKRPTQTSNTVFPLKDLGKEGIWSIAIIWNGYVAC